MLLKSVVPEVQQTLIITERNCFEQWRGEKKSTPQPCTKHTHLLLHAHDADPLVSADVKKQMDTLWRNKSPGSALKTKDQSNISYFCFFKIVCGITLPSSHPS